MKSLDKIMSAVLGFPKRCKARMLIRSYEKNPEAYNLKHHGKATKVEPLEVHDAYTTLQLYGFGPEYER